MPFLTIRRRGFPEAVEILTGLRAGKQMVRVVRDVVSRLARFVASINPVDTGAMRDSWTWTAVEMVGQAYISLSAYNPRTRRPVIEYAPYVDERVGLVDVAMDEAGRFGVEALTQIGWLGWRTL